MGRELTINIIQNTDCSFTVIDSTTYTSDDTNKAYVEFVIKDDSVVSNNIVIAESVSDIPTNTTLSFDYDGVYAFYKMSIPTLEYFKDGVWSYAVDGHSFYYNQSIYTPITGVTNITLDTLETSCNKVESIADLWNLRVSDDEISYGSVKFGNICRLLNCFLNRAEEYIKDAIDSECNNLCQSDTFSEVKGLFLLATLFLLQWLLCNGDFDEVKRILDIIFSCGDDFLCPEDIVNKIVSGGCNCGKS